MSPITPRSPQDQAMRHVATAAAAIVVAALVVLAGALLSWHAFAVRGSARGASAAGIALAPQGRSLVVDSLSDGGAAARAGLHVGDVVETVGGERPTGIDAADRALAAPVVDIRVRRVDKTLLIHLPPDRSTRLGQPYPADRGR